MKPGDVIEIHEKSKNIPFIAMALESGERDTPEYLEVDAKKMKVTFLRTPKLEDVPYPVQMEPHLVVEFYSR